MTQIERERERERERKVGGREKRVIQECLGSACKLIFIVTSIKNIYL